MHTPHPSNTELLQRALGLADSDSDDRWDLVTTLRRSRDPQVFAQASAWTLRPEPSQRRLGLDILAQFGAPELPFRAETLPLVLAALQDPDVGVLTSAIYAFGHLRIDEVQPLEDFLSHSDRAVRLALSSSLAHSPDPLIAKWLMQLTRDVDADVRDWATFSLGSLTDLDSAEIRDALVSGLDDAVPMVRAEALAGLARRKDPRALEPLRLELEGASPGELFLEAAEEFGHPALLPVLEQLNARHPGNPSIVAALAACQ